MESETFWSVVTACVTAASAAGYNFWQKWRDFQHGRQSVAVAIFSEISEAKDGAESLFVSWERMREQIDGSSDFAPLLVVSSDIRVLERVRIEDWHFSGKIVHTITSCQNRLLELYECLRTINNERFANLDRDGKLRLVNMAENLSTCVANSAGEALRIMEGELKEVRHILGQDVQRRNENGLDQ